MKVLHGAIERHHTIHGEKSEGNPIDKAPVVG